MQILFHFPFHSVSLFQNAVPYSFFIAMIHSFSHSYFHSLYFPFSLPDNKDNIIAELRQEILQLKQELQTHKAYVSKAGWLSWLGLVCGVGGQTPVARPTLRALISLISE